MPSIRFIFRPWIDFALDTFCAARACETGAAAALGVGSVLEQPASANALANRMAASLSENAADPALPLSAAIC